MSSNPEDYIRPFVRSLAQECDDTCRQVDLSDWEKPMNSYERDFLTPYLSDDLLIIAIEHNLQNCQRPEHPYRPCGTYDEAAIHKWLPELLRRFKETAL